MRCPSLSMIILLVSASLPISTVVASACVLSSPYDVFPVIGRSKTLGRHFHSTIMKAIKTTMITILSVFIPALLLAWIYWNCLPRRRHSRQGLHRNWYNSRTDRNGQQGNVYRSRTSGDPISSAGLGTTSTASMKT